VDLVVLPVSSAEINYSWNPYVCTLQSLQPTGSWVNTDVMDHVHLRKAFGHWPQASAADLACSKNGLLPPSLKLGCSAREAARWIGLAPRLIGTGWLYIRLNNGDRL